MTTQTQVRVPTQESAEFVKGINLTSATTLVIGSMIGSGIFIVSADIARLVESPALLILAWSVTGFMTIVGALAYGELAGGRKLTGGRKDRYSHGSLSKDRCPRIVSAPLHSSAPEGSLPNHERRSSIDRAMACERSGVARPEN